MNQTHTIPARLRELRYLSYREYLSSDYWASVRKRYYKSKLYDGACHTCRRKDLPLQIHHRTYKNLGHEKLNDLIALCGDCHREAHLILKTIKNSRLNIWNCAKKVRSKRWRKLANLPLKQFPPKEKGRR